MKRSGFSQIYMLLCGCGLLIMMAFSACSGTASTNDTSNGAVTAGSATASSVTGTVTAVNASAHSVTITVSANGQLHQYTVNGLTDQQVAELQSRMGKTFAFQATQNNGSYTIATGSTPQEMDNETPVVAQSASTDTTTSANGVVEPGSIDFIGKLQSSSASSMNLSMPNGDTLTVAITATTDRSDMVAPPAQGQYVKVKVLANTDGSFSAEKLGLVDSEDVQNVVKLNTASFQAVTNSAVSGDNVIHFSVGHKSFTATIGATTELKNFVNAQAIGNNQAVKLDVQFNGANATVLKIDNGND